jgi:transposase InsO family protein
MNIIMKSVRIFSIPELEKLIEDSNGLEFKSGGGNNKTTNKKETYAWIASTLLGYHYNKLKKHDRGVVTHYICKMTGYSQRQVKRLIGRWMRKSKLTIKPYQRNKFNGKYLRSDIILLAHVDEVNEVLSGPATRLILEREYTIYHKPEFEHLAGISSSHIYNLRKNYLYHQNIATFTKTKASKGPKNTLGIRRKPRPNGVPGFLRVDSVHQGDLPMDERQQVIDSVDSSTTAKELTEGLSIDINRGNLTSLTKGVYHINFVDEVLQWEHVACVETICERDMIPAIKAAIDDYPVVIHEFHADNGSEYMNKIVADLLNKLNIDLSKSRPRRHEDNALAETKNGAVIRKNTGYNHIPAKYADLINDWYQEYFNVYLNYHRPCGFATTTVDHKGKEHKVYLAKDYMTPYRKLKSLPNAEQYLKPGITFAQLDKIEMAMSDTEFAEKMAKAKAIMLSEIERREKEELGGLPM